MTDESGDRVGVITEISRQKKNKSRVSIFVDGEYFGSLDEKTFLESGLKTGDELGEEKWKAISERGEKQSAFDKGISYISKMMRSEKQVRDYLVKKGYEEPAVDYAVKKMSEYKYIDDEAFARMILSHQINIKKAGPAAVKDALWKYGIPNGTAEAVLLEYDGEAELENAKSQYQKLEKKYKGEADKLKKKQKITQAMARKGFDWDMITRVIRFYEETR